MVSNIIISGVGGQGILLAAKILAGAAERAGFEVSTNELHGMAQRGGSVTAQIRYGKGFFSPLIAAGEADILASLEAGEALRNAHWLKKDGLAVVSSMKIVPVTVTSGNAKYPDDIEERLRAVFKNIKYIDCRGIAAGLGDLRLANTVLLGALSAGISDIPGGFWREALEHCVKPRFFQSNATAFGEGIKSAGVLREARDHFC